MGRKGRFETYVKPYLEDIQEWYKLESEAQIAKRLGVSVATFENYKKKYPELCQALQKGKQSLIGDLKQSLKKKALGFTYKERKTYIKDVGGEKVKIIEEYERYAQPDTGAIHLLLKNLEPDWTNDDKTTIDLKRKQLELTERKIDQNDW